MKNKLAFYLIALGSLTLASCQSLPSSTVSESNSTNTSESTPSEVEKSYLLTIDAEEGIQIHFNEEKDDNKFLGGEEVSFTIELAAANKEIIKVLLNDRELTKTDDTYTFVMPAKDSTLKVESIVLGDENLFEEKPVTLEMIPTDVNGVIAALKNEQKVEGKYFSNGTFSYDTTESYDAVFNYEITAYQNDVLKVIGNKKMASNNPITTFFVEERGLTKNNRYYLYNYDSGSFSSNEPSGEYKESIKLYDVVKDDVEFPELNQKKESEVKNQITSYDFGGFLLKQYFDPSNSTGFASSYGWNNISVSSVASEDKLTFTTTLTATYDNYTNMEYHTLAMTFDGNYFLTNATYTGNEYVYSDFNNETNKPNDGATPINTSTLSITSQKGYKKYCFDALNIKDYAMHDYQVDVFYKQDDFEIEKAVDNQVELGSVLSFNYTSFDQNKYLIKPIVTGSKEEGFLEKTSQGWKVIKEGNFTLVFDNGDGELKEVNLTSVIPAAKEIDAKLEKDSLFIGEKTKLTASILPTSAKQNVEITIAEDSVGSVEYTKLDDNSYELTALTAGDVNIVVSATENPELSKTVTLKVIEKPNIDSIKKNLFENTMKYASSGKEFYINFNEDGTGTYRYGEEDYWSGGFTYEQVISFHYTIDEEKLTISITIDDDVSYGDATLISVSIIDNTSISAIIKFYDSNEDPMILTTSTRIDLSTLGSIY